MRPTVLYVFLILPIALIGQSSCPTTVHSGTATFYNLTGSVTCSLPLAEVPDSYAAVNPVDYGTADLCGSCLEVTGDIGTDTVYVVDLYPSTGAGWLDLSPTVFENTVGPQSIGQGAITWRVVSCAYLLPQTVELTLPGSNAWYLSFVFHKHTNPLATAEVLIGGVWYPMTRQNYNAWVYNPSSATSIVDVRVTDIFGQQLTITGIDASQNTLTYSAGGNFSPCISGSGSLDEENNGIRLIYLDGTIYLNSTEEMSELKVFDSQGKRIDLPFEQSDPFQMTLDVHPVSQGVYFAVFTSGLHTYSRKFIVH